MLMMKKDEITNVVDSIQEEGKTFNAVNAAVVVSFFNRLNILSHMFFVWPLK